MEMEELEKSVHNIPSIEEFNGLDENEISYGEMEFSSDDDDLDRMMAVLLGLFFEFYESCMYLGENYFNSAKFNEDVSKLNASLKDNWKLMMDDYIKSKHDYYDIFWLIPPNTVKSNDLNITTLIDDGINAVTDTLYGDLKDKSSYYNVMKNTSGKFLPHGNFRRGLKKLKTQIDYKTQSVSKAITRKYNEFVYGEDALFEWVCSGRNTCAWCYMIESESPMPLNMLPVDHPYGECRQIPHDPNKYSDDYIKVRNYEI